MSDFYPSYDSRANEIPEIIKMFYKASINQVFSPEQTAELINQPINKIGFSMSYENTPTPPQDPTEILKIQNVSYTPLYLEIERQKNLEPRTKRDGKYERYSSNNHPALLSNNYAASILLNSWPFLYDCKTALSINLQCVFASRSFNFPLTTKYDHARVFEDDIRTIGSDPMKSTKGIEWFRIHSMTVLTAFTNTKLTIAMRLYWKNIAKCFIYLKKVNYPIDLTPIQNNAILFHAVTFLLAYNDAEMNEFVQIFINNHPKKDDEFFLKACIRDYVVSMISCALKFKNLQDRKAYRDKEMTLQAYILKTLNKYIPISRYYYDAIVDFHTMDPKFLSLDTMYGVFAKYGEFLGFEISDTTKARLLHVAKPLFDKTRIAVEDDLSNALSDLQIA